VHGGIVDDGIDTHHLPHVVCSDTLSISLASRHYVLLPKKLDFTLSLSALHEFVLLSLLLFILCYQECR
jgi:hypothetical protein